MKQVIIAGGGFAGLHLARKLRKQKDIAVTIINPSTDFRYSPALYRAVVGFKMGIAKIPIEWALLDCKNASLKVAAVDKLDAAKKTITTSTGEVLSYDYAVFALGSKTSYFGISGLPELSYGIKSPNEVKELKDHIHDKLTNTNTSQHNYVIVGGGATGTELAGAMGSYLKKVAKLHSVNQSHIHIHLVEAGPRILAQMNEKAAKKTTKRLKRLGVHILPNTQVKAETAHTLQTSKGTIKTDTVIWTAGAQSSEFYKDYPSVFELDKRGKVIVDKHLAVNESLYVCGDNASTKYSGLALSAVWHADFLAKDIVARMHHKKRPTSYERPPAQIVPAGRAWAVMQYRGFVLTGRFASMVRRVADYVGYRDIVGTVKAFTIWSSSDTTEESCSICRK